MARLASRGDGQHRDRGLRTGNAPPGLYRRKGPPALLLRLIGPIASLLGGLVIALLTVHLAGKVGAIRLGAAKIAASA